jgi:Tfp pilus assembly protein PilF
VRAKGIRLPKERRRAGREPERLFGHEPSASRRAGRRVGRLSLLLALAAAFGGGGCRLVVPDRVTRSFDGRVVDGAFVPEEAYEAYLRGALAEGRRDYGAAEAAYGEAARLTPDAPDPWVRIGAARCARSPSSVETAEAAFARALDLDEAYAPAFAERARCALRRGKIAEAERDARRALELDPGDVAAGLLYVEILGRRGDRAAALRWIDNLALRQPDEPALFAKMLELARASGDPAHRAWAEREIARLRPASPTVAPRPAPGGLDALDALLRRGDLEGARARAVEQRLPASSLAVRAVALGAYEVGARQARLVLGADPNDADARVAALVSADALGDEAGFRGLLASAPARPGRPSALASLVLAELLRRRSEASAAEAVLDAIQPGDDDPLATLVRRRAAASR